MPNGSTLPGRAERLLLLLLLATAALLRLRGLEAPSLARDEIAQAVVGGMRFRELFRGVAGHHGAAPLDYVVTHVVEKAGRSEGLLRLPAAVWGVLSIWALHRLARRLAGEPRTALASAALLAIWPLHVRYSQEGRFYSLQVLLVLLSLERLAALDESPSPRRLVEAAGLLVLAVWTHVYTLLAAAAFLLYAAWEPRERPRRLRWVAAACAAPVLLYAPWFLFAGAGPKGSWRPHFPRPVLWPRLLVTGLEEAHFPVALASFALVMCAVAGLAAGMRERRRWVLLPAFLVLVGAAGIAFLDIAFAYFFHVRQLVFLIPAFVLLSAAGLTALADALSRALHVPRAAPLAALVLTIAVFLAPDFAASSQAWREDWRGTARFLRNAETPDTVIAAEPAGAYLEPFVLFYEPGLAGAFVPPSFLDAPTKGGPRRFFAFTQRYVGDISRAHAALSRVDVSVTPEFPILYLGDAPKETLLAEAARLDGVAARVFAEDVRARHGAAAAAALGTPEGALYRSQKGGLLTRAGRARFDAGDRTAAIAILLEAVAYAPADVEALDNLGLAENAEGRFADAAEVLARSARFHPESYWAAFLLGDAHRGLGDFARAAEDYRAAFAREPRPEALYLEAESLRLGGDPARARGVFAEVARRFPSTDVARLARERLP